MTTALLVWELGDGLGHVTRLIKIAERLTQKNVRCLFVVRNIELAGKYVRDRGFEVIQSPIATIDPIRGPDGTQPATMTDILGSIGFAKPERLAVLVSAWETLLDLIAPARPDTTSLSWPPKMVSPPAPPVTTSLPWFP